jgi:CRP/FNR family transcriptional regulator, cyclic AMP receptor protein
MPEYCLEMVHYDLLKKVYLFQGFSEDELGLLADLVQENTVITGDYIFDEGAKATSLFMIKDGSVEILKNSAESDEQKVTIFSAGSHFGEMALLDASPRAASAVAKENTHLLEIRYEDLQQLLEKEQEIGLKLYRNFAQALCKRMRQTTSDLSTLKQMKLRQL